MGLAEFLLSWLPGWGLWGRWVDARLAWSLVGLLIAGVILRMAFFRRRRQHLERLRVQKQVESQQAIDTLRRKLADDNEINTELKAKILELKFEELQNKLKSGELKPSDVLLVYQLKALEAHERTNCLVEPIWEAEPQALELKITQHDGQLFGIPVSLKDCYGIQGYDCTVGLSQWIEKPFPEDCVIVKVLKQQGAIPYVKTNVPQLMLSFETSNPIYGRTTNPFDKTRGPGGSSGGEGALVACGGSVLGFGSDIGGSIRIPAAFCGVCGLKPTMGRISEKGMFPLWEGQTDIKADYGPLAQEVNGLVAAMRALLTPLMFQLDPGLPPVPFNEQVFTDQRRLRIGYYTYDGFFHAVPSCQRAVLEAVQALSDQGHEVVEWDFPKFGTRILQNYMGTLFGDGGKEPLKHLADNTIDPVVKFAKLMWSLNNTLKKMIPLLLGVLGYKQAAACVRKAVDAGSVTAWWKQVAENKALRQEVLHDWRSQGLDVVVFPGFSSPAMPHGLPAQCTFAMSYTGAYNFLQLPTGSLPVTKVTQDDVAKMADYPTPDPWHKMLKEAQAGTEGLPVGVQVAALPWQDELVLRVMKELEITLKNKDQNLQQEVDN